LGISPRNLAGHCGLYCGSCPMHQGKFAKAVGDLRGLMAAFGFDKSYSDLAKWEPAFKNYKEFEGVLDGIVRLFGSCPGCMGGGGDPSCAIRTCCRRKAYATCAECAEIDKCEMAKGRVQLEEIKRIRDMGVGRWADEMQRKAGASFQSKEGP